MNNDLQKLRDRLESLLAVTSLSSQEVLLLSEEVDLLILEFYKQQDLPQEYSYSRPKC